MNTHLRLLALTFFILSSTIVNAEVVLPTPFEILGVEENSDGRAIRAAYIKLVKQYHPDRISDPSEKTEAEKKIKAINAAYEQIKDAQARSSYSNLGRYDDIEDDVQRVGESWDDYLERMNEQGTLNYFTATAYSEMKWKKRKPGNDYAAAVDAFENNSYYASEDVQKYDLTQEQVFEFAQKAAKSHGAVFSDLIQNFKIQNIEKRFELGLIAAQSNSWANVEFVVDNFDLASRPSLRLRLAEAALRRSGYQGRFIRKWKKKWQLSDQQVFRLLLILAKRPDSKLKDLTSNLKLVELTEAQRVELALAIDIDEIEEIKKFKLSRESLLQIARVKAQEDSYFPKKAALFKLAEEEAFELAKINLLNTRFNNRLKITGPDGFNLSDSNIWRFMYEVYVLNQPFSDLLYEVIAFSGYYVSDIWNFDVVTNNGSNRSERMEWEQEKFKRLEEFSNKHPLLLPPKWYDAVNLGFLEADLRLPLLRIAYRLSNAKEYFSVQDSEQLLIRTVGLSDRFSGFTRIYSDEHKNLIYRALLFISQYISYPYLEKIDIDPRIFNPQNLSTFIRFVQLIHTEIVGDMRYKTPRQEQSVWTRTVHRFRLRDRPLTPERLEKIVKVLSKKDCAELLVVTD